MRLRSLFISGGIALAPLLGLTLVFGSIREFAAWSRGEYVEVVPTPFGLLEAKKPERVAIRVTLRNRSGEPITVCGATASCGCVDITPMPVVIPPHATKSLLVHLNTERMEAGNQGVSVVFHFDRTTAVVSTSQELVIVESLQRKPKSASADELKAVPLEANRK